MIYQLRELAREIGPGIEDFLATRLPDGLARGVLLAFDESWMDDWLGREILRHWWPYGHELAWEFRHRRIRGGPWLGGDLRREGSYWSSDAWRALRRAAQTISSFARVRFDTGFRPPGWFDHCRLMGYPENAQPIVIKVILKSREPERKGDLPRSYEGYPIIYEVRPSCEGYASVSPLLGASSVRRGASIKAKFDDSFGTLGGFLTDRDNGSVFLVSCCHVLGMPGTAVLAPGRPGFWSRPKEVGEVITADLPPCEDGQRIGRRHPRAGLSGALGTVDFALARLEERVSIRPFREVSEVPLSVNQNMVQGEEVHFVAARSGLVRAEIGSLCLNYEITIRGSPRWFRDLFELKHIHPYYFNLRLAKPGDSGAWIVSTLRPSPAWDGMLIGGDGAQAYCCFADNLLSRLDELGQNAPGQYRLASPDQVPQFLPHEVLTPRRMWRGAATILNRFRR